MMIFIKPHRSAAKGCYSETARRQTDELGAEFPHRTFGRDRDVTPLRPKHTNLDTIFDVLSRDHALFYEPAFEPSSLQCIPKAYPSVISLSDKEQQNARANMLCLSPDSEVIKSGGSMRCDTLPVERDS
jgi:N-dimethylarginine dimethylaminohydrolase